MQKLKEVYDIKKQIITEDISKLGDILKENSNIETINVNSDNTIYLESNCGLDSIKNDLDEGIKKWLWIDQKIVRSMILNTLPIGKNSCIVKA